MTFFEKVLTERTKRILFVILWYAYFFLMVMVARDLYQNHKDFHYHIASIVLIAIAMLLRKDFKLSFLSFIPASAIVLGGINCLYDARMEFGREYKLVLLSRYCLIAAFVIWVLSILLSEKRNKPEWKKTLGGVLLLIFVILASIIKYNKAYYFAIPLFLILSVGKLERRDISEQMKLIAIAMYLNFFISMTVSVISKPNLGSTGRYEGIFFFPVVVGFISSTAIFASLYYLKTVCREWKNLNLSRKRKRVLIFLLLIIYPIIMLVLSGNRAILLGNAVIIITFLVRLICLGSKKVKITAIIVAAVLMIGGSIGVVWMSHNFNSVEFAERINLDKQSMGYYFVVHLPQVSEYNSTGVFEPGTLMASLDATSSDRLGIWVTGLKKVTLLGKNDTSIILPTGEDAGHVHSTYIFWLLFYGAIAGAIGIVWMIYNFVEILIRLFHRNGELIPALFIMLALGVFSVENEQFMELLPMLMLIFSYRFFYDIDDESKEKMVETDG